MTAIGVRSMSWVAGLPMYELDATRSATDAFWTGLARACRAQGIPDVPDRLDRELGMDALWHHSGLLFAQTCGGPFTHALAGRVRLIATPVYDAPGCAGADYRSLIVVREDDPAAGLKDLLGRRVAINGLGSHSGLIALRATFAAVLPDGGDRPALGRAVVTGSHLASMEAVRAGRADLAAIDAVLHGLVARHVPERLSGLRVLAASPPAPGLPFVAGPAVDDGLMRRLRRALDDAMQDPVLAAAREDLLLSSIEVLEAAAYDRIGALERLGSAVAIELP